MNYERVYFKFIEEWKCQHIPEGTYTERHHIIPKHCGGTDDEENLVKLTYRQHTFAHRLLWKAYAKPQDRMCWKMMSAIEHDKKFAMCQMAGKIGGAKNRASGHMSRVGKEHGPITGARNVESGFLDEIRVLANNDVQRAWARELGRSNVESGQLDRVSQIAYSNLAKYGPTEKRKAALDVHNKRMAVCPKAKDNLRRVQKISVEARKLRSSERSENAILNAERNQKFLHVKPRGRYWYVSPEGLKFGTTVAAANYYGTVKKTDVQNWCIREHHGWHREIVIR